VRVWEWRLMGRNKEWEMKRQSGSEGERTKKQKIKREKKIERIKNQYFVLELCCSTIAKKFAIVEF